MGDASFENQLDIGTLIARIEQINRERPPEHWLWDRIMTCDIPRMKRAVTNESLQPLLTQILRKGSAQ